MFAGIPIKYVEHPEPVRGRAEYGGNASLDIPTEVAVTDNTTREWVDACCAPLLSDLEAREAMSVGMVSVEYEVSSKDLRSADNSIALARPIDYVYTEAAATQLHQTYAGRHFVARPEINRTVVDAMYSAPSADKFVQATGMKLPRVMASASNSAGVAGVPGEGAPMSAADTASNQFEATRRAVSQYAKSDDYGQRLFNLARVVLHSRVVHTLGLKPDRTPAMSAQGMHFMLANEALGLTITQLRSSVFLYVHTDDTPDYRAFLTMGVRGMHNYAGVVGTIYSNCRIATEDSGISGDGITFVRVGGEKFQATTGIPEAVYTRVLSNPEACLAYYYAYARSMGLGEVATAVLCQAAVGPHIWGADAISPYKTCNPKLDAAAYSILPSVDDAHVALTDTRGLVHNASLIAGAVMAGIGALCMSFKSGKDVDSQEVMRQTVDRLADPETRRGLVRAVTGRYSGGSIGLEWLSPFSYDVMAGLRECVAAWRSKAVLLSLYRTTPIMGLSQLFTSGVDMRNAMIGRGVTKKENGYAQLMAGCLAVGEAAPGRCERVAVAVVARVNGIIPRMREWKPVVTLVRFRAVEGPSGKLADSPGRHAQAALQTESTTDAPSSMTSAQESRSALLFEDDDDGESEDKTSSSAPPVVRKPAVKTIRTSQPPPDDTGSSNGHRQLRELRLSSSSISAGILSPPRKTLGGASDAPTTTKSVASASTIKPILTQKRSSSGSDTGTKVTSFIATDKVNI